MLRLALLSLALAAAVPTAVPAAAQTQAEMTATACARRDASDGALNAAYRDALAAAPDTLGRRRLREAQRAWLRFRDAETAALFPLAPGADPRLEYGSVYPMRLCAAVARLTDARAAQLRERADCPVGDPCSM